MKSQVDRIQTARWSFRDLDCAKLLTDLPTWVGDQVQILGEPAWLLVFTRQGSAWGVVQEGALQLAENLFPGMVTPLTRNDLQEVYLFSEKGQAHAWYAGTHWQGKLLIDGGDLKGEFFDQELILWGTRLDDWKDGFALLREGVQGMVQAVPLEQKPTLQANRAGAPRLVVRSYLAQDPRSGAAYVAASRLVQLVS